MTSELIDQIAAQIEALPEVQRRVHGVKRSGQEIVDGLPLRVEEVLRVAQSRLTEAMVWGVEKDGRLTLGDGCADPAPETLNLGYLRARDSATAVGVSEGGNLKVRRLPHLGAALTIRPQIVTIGVGEAMQKINRVETPLIWVARLATPHEYRVVNTEGRFERNEGRLGSDGFKAWLNGGDNPRQAPLGWYNATERHVVVHERGAFKMQGNRGARRVVDFYLNLDR